MIYIYMYVTHAHTYDIHYVYDMFTGTIQRDIWYLRYIYIYVHMLYDMYVYGI